MPKYSKNALNCARCPGKRGDGGCPMWWESQFTNGAGDVRYVKSCGFEQLPQYLIEVIKASNRPAAAIESTRNEIAEGLARIAGATAQTIAEFADRRSSESLGGPRDLEGSELHPLARSQRPA